MCSHITCWLMMVGRNSGTPNRNDVKTISFSMKMCSFACSTQGVRWKMFMTKWNEMRDAIIIHFWRANYDSTFTIRCSCSQSRSVLLHSRWYFSFFSGCCCRWNMEKFDWYFGLRRPRFSCRSKTLSSNTVLWVFFSSAMGYCRSDHIFSVCKNENAIPH